MTARTQILRQLGLIPLLGLCLVLTLWCLKLPVSQSMVYLYNGALKDHFAIARTLLKTLPLLLTGLGITLAWRAGMYNVGGEGQFVVGGLTGAAIAKFVPLTGPLGQILILIGCLTGGALWAWISGWLQVKRQVSTVISTILMNFVAFNLLDYLVAGPLQEAKKELRQTELLSDNLRFLMLDRATQVHIGLPLSLVVLVLVWIFLAKTWPGFLMRVCGVSPTAARANRIANGRYQLLAMTLSGALCGLAAGFLYLGTAGQITTSFAQGWGFYAIPVALLGSLEPLAVAWVAILFGLLFAGTDELGRRTPGGNALVGVVQGVAVLAVLGGQIAASRVRKPKAGEEE